MEDPIIQETNQSEIICRNCSAKLKFAPGTTSLKCEYCGAENEIEIKQEAIEEIDFVSFIETEFNKEEKVEVATVRCNACGAETSMKENVVSDMCPFCGNPLVVKEGSTRSLLKPKSLLPFNIDPKKAQGLFQKWIGGLWFAPSGLKKYAQQTEKLTGIYIPYWTYDSNTSTSYSGQRGDNYQTSESYTTTDSSGNAKTETRTVTKVRWTYVSGHVSNSFDDVLVVGSNSLPRKYADELEPWDLDKLLPFDEKFLSGFKTESYQVDVKQGFDYAKVKMDKVIESTIRTDIGGDLQQISSKNTAYNDITFKHILLPLWISAYRYNQKVYRFMINARTGEVQGERPYSWIKITLAVLVGIAIIGGIVWFAKK
ncbi:MAG TPA: hypothetical protein DEH02_06785 [Bacteroidales bacterium]|nr:MAG: hypothetical protein A2X01_13375 [Bacteroidetes bacterium GWF2_35_48]OFY97230.1 MAG: hypothetical protein A2491_17640 [Bacteroidetes bacterium RIFOXYC12_FULL_35_7]HBX50762.1 hypothetical protein [Bacteroidales bacterium]